MSILIDYLNGELAAMIYPKIDSHLNGLQNTVHGDIIAVLGTICLHFSTPRPFCKGKCLDRCTGDFLCI